MYVYPMEKFFPDSNFAGQDIALFPFYAIITVGVIMIFSEALLPYFLQALSCAAVTALSCFAAGLICDRIPLGGTGKLIANFAVCAIVSNVLLFLAYFRTKLFQSSLKLVTRMIRRNGK